MTQNTPKISVIIPVYNVEKYLRQCLDSIVNQTLQEIEIICINDGSSDSSQEILEEYAAKDKRITVLKQQNSGQGAARNHGMKIATAPYMYFVDSDDWIDLHCLEKLYTKMSETDADICTLGVYAYDETLKQFVNLYYLSMGCYKNRPAEICCWRDIKSTIFRRWGPPFKIYKTKFLRQNNILFPQGVQFEDVMFHLRCMILAQKITFCDENLAYYRRNRPQSIMDNGKTDNIVFDVFCFLRDSYDFLQQQNVYNDLRQEYARFVLDQLAFHLSRMAPQFKEDFTAHAKEFCLTHNLANCWQPYPQLYPLYKQVFGCPYKVSIIIPVYNAEKYLHQCLDSVVNQTLHEIEIICINDGSTDSSLQILEEYASKDSRIKVMTQENAGIGAARNIGIKHSHAKGIMFVDSDDYIADDMVEKMYNSMRTHQADVVVCDANILFDDDINSNQQIRFNDTADSWFEKFRKPEGLYKTETDVRAHIAPVVWNKLYKSDIITDHKLCFTEGLVQEDEYWLWVYMIHCNNYYFINEKLYSYVYHKDSILDTLYTSEKAFDIFEQYKKVYRYIKNYKDITLYKSVLAQYFIRVSNDRLKHLDAKLHPQLLDKIRYYTFNCNPSETMLEYYRKIRRQISDTQKK